MFVLFLAVHDRIMQDLEGHVLSSSVLDGSLLLRVFLVLLPAQWLTAAKPYGLS